MLPSVVVVVVGLHDYVSIILYLTITVRHYTLGTTLKIYFSYFPCGKKVVCIDALTKVCALVSRELKTQTPPLTDRFS